jgi:selenide,water dikinase
MNNGPRLTQLAHGGGCGCKLSPAVLREVLADMPQAQAFPNLLVGIETGDDAAVWQLNERQALVATTDFFTPIVDDPFEFGRIAAANALSDVYAMGATPLFALAILGMPLGVLDLKSVRAIVAGGASICTDANIPVAGGHSIDSPEPIYGLVALGLVHSNRILRNRGAQPGDRLILTKGLGVGVFSAALKLGRLDESNYRTLIASTTQLNRLGLDLPAIEGVHAVTDVTGFGLLGHALEVCRASQVRARFSLAALPLLPGAQRLAEEGIGTGAATRNWASYGGEVALHPGLAPWAQGLLCDPQTSGGLLISVSPADAAAVLERAAATGFALAADVGEVTAGAPGAEVIP